MLFGKTRHAGREAKSRNGKVTYWTWMGARAAVTLRWREEEKMTDCLCWEDLSVLIGPQPAPYQTIATSKCVYVCVWGSNDCSVLGMPGQCDGITHSTVISLDYTHIYTHRCVCLYMFLSSHTHPVTFFSLHPRNSTGIYDLQHTNTESHTLQCCSTINMFWWKEVKVKISDPYIFFPIQQ